MIKHKRVTDRGIEIEQIASRPTVYLDNWALNLFSNDRTVGGRFTDLLSELEGILAVSIINVLEVVERTDRKQASNIRGFLDLVDGVFIDIDPARVIQKEQKLGNTDRFISRSSPCANLHLLKALEDAHNPLKPFKISQLILELQKEMKDGKDFIQEDFERDLRQRITKARNDKTVLSKAKNRFRNKSKGIRTEFPCTQDLCSRSIDFIVINESMRMPDKEWRDLFHCIVPVGYCDFVLIDSR